MITSVGKDKSKMFNFDLNQEFLSIALAAGRGSRLYPLTDSCPKPLVPFCGIEILSLVIKKFEEVGLTDIGLNAHYRHEMITDFVGGLQGSDKIRYHISYEYENLLGTAGCYPPFDKFRAGRSILTANGDVLSSINLNDLIAFHRSQKADATMAVLSKPHHPDATHIWVENGEIKHIGKSNGGFQNASPHGFACFQILEDNAIAAIPQSEYSELVSLYDFMIKSGKKISAYIHSDDWFDLGTHDDYFKAHMHFLSKLDALNIETQDDEFSVINSLKANGLRIFHVKTGKTKKLCNNVNVIGPSLIIGNPRIPDKNHFVEIGPHSIVMDQVVFASDCHVSQSIILPNSIVNEDHDNKIIYEQFSINIKNL